MELLRSAGVDCPHCGERLDIDVDCSVEAQSYVEDCQVCCRPIVVSVRVDGDGEPAVAVRAENE